MNFSSRLSPPAGTRGQRVERGLLLSQLPGGTSNAGTGPRRCPKGKPSSHLTRSPRWERWTAWGTEADGGLLTLAVCNLVETRRRQRLVSRLESPRARRPGQGEAHATVGFCTRPQTV